VTSFCCLTFIPADSGTKLRAGPKRCGEVAGGGGSAVGVEGSGAGSNGVEYQHRAAAGYFPQGGGQQNLLAVLSPRRGGVGGHWPCLGGTGGGGGGGLGIVQQQLNLTGEGTTAHPGKNGEKPGRSVRVGAQSRTEFSGDIYQL